jgi:hypothetical protein
LKAKERKINTWDIIQNQSLLSHSATLTLPSEGAKLGSLEEFWKDFASEIVWIANDKALTVWQPSHAVGFWVTSLLGKLHQAHHLKRGKRGGDRDGKGE